MNEATINDLENTGVLMGGVMGEIGKLTGVGRCTSCNKSRR